MIYEVINPSDVVTFEADDLAIARAAVLLVGRGQYGIGEPVLIHPRHLAIFSLLSIAPITSL